MKAILRIAISGLICLLVLAGGLSAQTGHEGHDHDGHDHPVEKDSGAHGEEAAYDPVSTIMHHIADANEFHLFGEVSIPLPVILYAPGHGLTTGLSSMFHHGATAVDGYVMNHGRVNRIADASFPEGHVDLEGEGHHFVHESEDGESAYVMAGGKQYMLDKPSTLDGGLMGGGITSFYDFSITKNVLTMMLAALLLFIIFGRVSSAYKKRGDNAPAGLQGFLEPVFVFIRDEVARPMIGEKHYERFLPFIMSIFFFILVCNLLGLIPFFPGSSNVTGNIGVTMVLAFLVFLVTNFSGNKHYWEHTLWMPGVPWWVKLFVLTPVEVLGLVIKPVSLMIRLFANITAGHIIILSLIGLIFVFGNNGASVGGAATGAVVGGLFTAFMNLIELLVAFLQAFIFAMLSASYIGAAVEDHDHHDEDHATDHHHGGAYAEKVAHH